MSTHKRFDDQVSGWLEQAAPARLPDRVLEATFERTRTSRQQIGWRRNLGRVRLTRPVFAFAGAATVVTVALVGFSAYTDRSAVGPGGALPPDDPRSTFLGTWYSTSDADGGTQTMIVRATGGDALEIVVTDTIATVCKGTPSTMTGNGSVSSGTLVIPAPAYACDDGSEPKALSGPPLQDQLRNLTYVRDARADTLTVGSTSVWTRAVAAAPSTDPSPSPGAAALPDFSFGSLSPTFESLANGYTFKYLDRGRIEPATEPWDPDHQPPIGDELDTIGAPYHDQFDVVETGLAAVFLSASTEVPDGVAIDTWVDASVVKYLSSECHVPRSQQAAITIDGQSGRISECAEEVVATVIVNERLYLFILAHSRPDARAFFDAFAATIDLRADTPYYFANSTPTFESLINGYSFKYIDRGGLEPATERWDPTQPPSGGDRLNGDQFDSVDTGFGAGFFSASTEIPDGASIDEWIDASVVKSLSSGRCHVPRSQQAEITIDGQSGRISECSDEIVATVVVDGRLYLFAMLHNSRADAREFFDAFADTIDLRPVEVP